MGLESTAQVPGSHKDPRRAVRVLNASPGWFCFVDNSVKASSVARAPGL